MNRTTKQVIIAVLFVFMLGWVWYRGRLDSPSLSRAKSSDTKADTAEALKRYGFALQNKAEEFGIRFIHQSTQLDSKLDHIMPIVSGMGAGATIADFDSDGRPDIYFVTGALGGSNALYRNTGEGRFEECAEAWHVARLNEPGSGACMGAVAADYDNDGFQDLLVYKWGRPELFHNRGGQSFDNVTADSGLPSWLNANSACWLDYNRDGLLDLFIAGYWSEKINLFDLKTTQVMPESFEYATNGGRKYLLRNDGNSRFTDVTAEVGITSTRWTLGVASAILTDSGYPDLVLANDYGVSELYRNVDGKRFVEVGDISGIGKTPKSGMSASFGDVLNQASQAIYITNITEPGNLVQGNNLWIPVDHDDQGIPLYLNQAGNVQVERGGWSWGARFGDLNNDGRQDLFLTNGYISAEANQSYWYDYGKIAGGLKGLISEAKYWPPIGKQSLSGYQSKCLWINKGGSFIDVAGAVGVQETYDGRAVAMADLFGRGVLDVVVSNQNGPALIYQNQTDPANEWIQFELIGGAGPESGSTYSNRNAIGAELILEWQNDESGVEQKQSQVITAGDGYASQSMLRLHFGLGKNPRVVEAMIRWPSGRVSRIPSPEPGRVHRLLEKEVTEIEKSTEGQP